MDESTCNSGLASLGRSSLVFEVSVAGSAVSGSGSLVDASGFDSVADASGSEGGRSAGWVREWIC